MARATERIRIAGELITDERLTELVDIFDRFAK